jgi:hypothetical protein
MRWTEPSIHTKGPLEFSDFEAWAYPLLVTGP